PSYSFDYNENQTAGVTLGTVSATDADASDTVSYTITVGNDANHFQIDAAGAISLTKAGAVAFTNDYEAEGNTHVLTVTASDGTNSSHVTVTLNEQNVDDVAPAFTSASTADANEKQAV